MSPSNEGAFNCKRRNLVGAIAVGLAPSKIELHWASSYWYACDIFRRSLFSVCLFAFLDCQQTSQQVVIFRPKAMKSLMSSQAQAQAQSNASYRGDDVPNKFVNWNLCKTSSFYLSSAVVVGWHSIPLSRSMIRTISSASWSCRHRVHRVLRCCFGYVSSFRRL
mmetsp:Transcript_17176/g.48282  ORF Transcript_17176/g.48282 Transcript_17176/m.48282 type:complete len:164 (-) Transcript_17176:988-1479(-)